MRPSNSQLRFVAGRPGRDHNAASFTAISMVPNRTDWTSSRHGETTMMSEPRGGPTLARSSTASALADSSPSGRWPLDVMRRE